MTTAAVKSITSLSKSQAQDDPVREAWERVVVRKESPGQEIRAEVLRSWKRCREIGLDPFRKVPPPVLSGNELDRLIRLNQDLIEFSEPMLDMIQISVRDRNVRSSAMSLGGRCEW